jgi:hypothetical protein
MPRGSLRELTPKPQTAPSVSQKAALGSRQSALEEAIVAGKKALTESHDKLRKRCKSSATVSFDWQASGRDRLSLARHLSACRALINELRGFCRSHGTLRSVASITAIECKVANAPKLTFEGGTITLALVAGKRYPRRIKKALLAMAVGPQKRFADLLSVDATSICKDGEHLAVVAPHFARKKGLSVGEGRDLIYVGSHRGLLGTHFYEPRYRYKKPLSFPGKRSNQDWAYISTLRIDRKRGACSLHCGKQSKRLVLVGDDEKAKILANARYKPRPDIRKPHRLARDQRGTYYFVDRSALRGKKDFRVYVGQRGKLTRQKMIDVVVDSEGEVFATKRGKLRLLLGKKEALWIRGRRKKRLMQVPIDKNMALIYKELGVYWGKRLYTPCDHF